MNARKLVRLFVPLTALLMILSACGQKPGVRIGSGAQGQGGDGGEMSLDASGEGEGGDSSLDGSGTTTGGDSSLDGSGTTTGGDTAGGTTGSSDGGTTTGGSASGGDGGGGDGGTTDGGSASGGDSGGTSGGSSGGSREPQGSDRTGVTDEKITIGIHAPVTGAAPLPVTSFEKSRDLYWKYVTQTRDESVLGRKQIDVLFRDDKYDPNSAVQVCREMASQAFFLVGGGGTDQIQACGRYANQAKVPYFSAGVTENGLRGLPWYFASSMSYKQQGGLLAQYIKKNFAGKKVAAVVTDTPNFDDAVAGWEQGVQQQGLNYYKTLRHPKGDSSWYNSYASELKQAGVEILYVNTAPVDYIRFAQQANNQGYNPQYMGVGITMGLNAVLGSGCDDVDGGIFFSPFPGLDWARQNEPEFFEAGQNHGAPTDDIALALWGIAKQEHVLFQRYGQVFGNDLTREDFRAATEQQQEVETGVFPTVSYSPQDHFGANTTHVLQADCGKGEHVTLATFASGF